MKQILPLCLLLCASALSPEELFRSNSIGMTLEKITPYRQDNFEYVLRVIREKKETLVKILMKNGKEHKKWIEEELKEGEIVTYFEEGKKREETFFTGDSRIQRIVRYGGDEEVTEELTHYYEQGELDYVLVSGGGGEELYRIVYEQGKHGRLRKMKRIYPEYTRESLYTFGRNAIAAEWHGEENTGDLFRFERDQQLSSLEKWSGSEKTAEKTLRYDEATLEYSVEVDYLANVVTKTWYNERGLKKRVLTESIAALIAETQYEYNEQDDVREKRVWTPGVREKREYTYSEPGELAAETYYKNGALISKIEYINDSTYYEYLYRNGEPFIKITYIDDEKVDETLMIGSAGGVYETK